MHLWYYIVAIRCITINYFILLIQLYLRYMYIYHINYMINVHINEDKRSIKSFIGISYYRFALLI